ncbi:antirepressor KilAC domain-containing protein [Edwardsiella phage PVN06]|nr:antirepressor KilAC domain-containing protein [Edwardsiella phage PVN06]
MNQLITKSAETTMSSVEIAELTGKRHDSVLRDIRSMLDEIQSPQKRGDYKDTRGRTQPCLLRSVMITSSAPLKPWQTVG